MFPGKKLQMISLMEIKKVSSAQCEILPKIWPALEKNISSFYKFCCLLHDNAFESSLSLKIELLPKEEVDNFSQEKTQLLEELISSLTPEIHQKSENFLHFFLTEFYFGSSGEEVERKMFSFIRN